MTSWYGFNVLLAETAINVLLYVYFVLAKFSNQCINRHTCYACNVLHIMFTLLGYYPGLLYDGNIDKEVS